MYFSHVICGVSFIHICFCFYLSRARKRAKKNDDNKVEVYDEPDPVSKEQTVLWLMDVLCCLVIAVTGFQMNAGCLLEIPTGQFPLLPPNNYKFSIK